MNENAPHPGLEIAKGLKLGGCILVLVISVVCVALLLSPSRDPLKDYEAPRSGEYYAGHLPELKAELEKNVFPLLPGAESCEISGDRLVVTLTGEDYAVPRAALLKHFDGAPLEFVAPVKEK